MANAEAGTPRLPTELEREIFEQAASHSEGTAFSLLTVSKRVHEWIEPTLYRVIVQRSVDLSSDSTKSSPFFTRLFEGYRAQSPSSLRQVSFVKAVVVNLNEEVTDLICTILDACPNVIDLALWTSYDELVWDKLLGISDKPLQKLSMHAGVDKVPPIFSPSSRLNSTLTHLDFFDVNVNYTLSTDTWPTWWWKDFINSLPRLTYFAIDGNDLEDIIKLVLDESPSLELLVLVSIYHAELEGIKALDDSDLIPLPLFTQDPRFVYVPAPEEVLDVWVSGARGGRDVWTMGQDLQKQKIERLRQHRLLEDCH
ncbi:hypothetical protein CPB83DRAFT_904898 [Crepidotus variabilis]|uniref:Uncharacterized protein n=1 Tax=Crepidotus variabilis TaxID=179855 RepID=A0A9P6JS38_9AGAR|nr:hypothetical protein CPB83DRAFT_904898 [Crepidotus variabilis]